MQNVVSICHFCWYYSSAWCSERATKYL